MISSALTKSQKRQLIAKAMRGNRRRCLSGWVWGGLAGSCVSWFFANFAPTLLNVADQLPLHVFRCNGVSGGRRDADRHTYIHTHTHTYTYRRSCLKLQSEASGSAHQRSWGWKTQDKEKDRQRDWPSDWRLFSTNKGYVCSLDGQLQIRLLVLVSSYLIFFWVRLLLCACHLVHDMPVRCVSVALNSAMNKAHFISIGRTLLAIIFVMLDERGRERAILVCVCVYVINLCGHRCTPPGPWDPNLWALCAENHRLSSWDLGRGQKHSIPWPCPDWDGRGTDVCER